MRSDQEIRENLEWLKDNCRNYKNEEQGPVVHQLSTLIWVLGADPDAAQAEAEAIWAASRNHRRQSPSDY